MIAVGRKGIAASLAVAEPRFRQLCEEYWRLWLFSGDGYEGFVAWLVILKRQVSAEVASVWKGGSKSVDDWYERGGGPAVEKALTALAKEEERQARSEELKRLQRGATPNWTQKRASTSEPSAIGTPYRDVASRSGNVVHPQKYLMSEKPVRWRKRKPEARTRMRPRSSTTSRTQLHRK